MVDDDIDDQEIFELALKKVDEAINLSIANNGVEALQRLKENTSFIPDIIFLDINMPKMNGIQCLPELKKLEHLKSARIVVYSTTPNEIIKRTTQELGADEFLVKPTRIGLLVDNLSRILETNNV